MKKLISIFFLLSFFLFRYGKMLDYMECRIAAAIESKTDCGCDSKLSATSQESKNPQPLHQHHLKNYTEEFFDHQHTSVPRLPAACVTTAAVLPAEKLPAGFARGIFQPPRI
ncbi:MAG: hypothetical protein K2X48_03535 [Chitinophagaceae bacterium]|nr:hypothetical protein [Chitinophagaceae bacterium]